MIVSDFVHSLCLYVVAQAAALSPALTLGYGAASPSAKLDLWRNEADESVSNNSYSVLRLAPGPAMTWYPLPRCVLQLQTYGRGNDAASTRAQSLFECLLAANGQPLRMTTIAGRHAADDTADGHWLIVGADALQRPGMIARDERGQATYSQNFDVRFRKVD